ncbi:MAG: T9SS type A sorting domain-containing protein, partial [Bacteroidota bacterium]
PSVIDISSVTDGTNSIQTAGTYAIEVIVQDECSPANTITRIGHFEVNAPPTPASIVFEFCDGSGFLSPACPTFTNPITCTAATVGGAFSLGNSTGDIDYYRIDRIEEINCVTGAFVSLIHQETANNTNFNEVINCRNFNNITVSSTGQQGFFLNNALNKCYKITVSVGNICGESSTDGFILFDRVFRPATGGEQPTTPAYDEPLEDPFSIIPDGVMLSPNPGRDFVTLTYKLDSEQQIQFEMLDVHGKRVMTPISDVQRAGGHSQKIDIQSLASGIYIYRMRIGETQHTGRLIKQ